jgi:hypothetical protein
LKDREGVCGAAARYSTAQRPTPREIRITKAIGEVKKAILKGSRDIAVRQPATAHR